MNVGGLWLYSKVDLYDQKSDLTRLYGRKSAATRAAVSLAVRNQLKSVSARLKPLLILGFTATLMVAIAGCSETASPVSANKNTTSPSPAANLCNPAEQIYGDSIAKKAVSDDLGKYCQTALNPKAEAYKKDVSKYDLVSLGKYGFTEEQAFQAQKTVVAFIGDQALDSSALDTNFPGTVGNDDAGMAWYAAHSDLIDSSTKSKYENSGDLKVTGIVLNGYLPPLIRDGKPRLSKTAIELVSVYAGVSTINSLPQINVSAKFKGSYRATVDNAIKWISDNYGKTTEQVIKENPELAAKTGDKNMLFTGDMIFAVNPLNQKFNGNNFHFNMVIKLSQVFDR